MVSVDQENLLHTWKIGRNMSEELEISNEGGNERTILTIHQLVVFKGIFFI